MYSIQIKRFGGPEVLVPLEHESPPFPPPSKSTHQNWVRVQVLASGVNFADCMMRMGLYPEAPRPPFVPGYEFCGKVIELSSQNSSFELGQRVVGFCQFKGYSSEVIVSEEQLALAPSRLSDEELAAVPVNFMTAWVALHEMARIRKGDRVLVHSAAGGVGTAAVQMICQAGADAFGLVGTDVKRDPVLQLGAKEVWTHSEWRENSKAKAQKFDVVLDCVGGKSLTESFEKLSPMGRVISFGLSAGVSQVKRNLMKAAWTVLRSPRFSPFRLMMHNKGVYGLNMLQLMQQPGSLKKQFEVLLGDLEEGKLKAIVGKTFPLRDAGAAQAYLQSRQSIGKVVLKRESQ